MRIRAAGLLFVASLLAAPGAAGAIAHFGKEIRGYVVDAVSGEPLAGVVVLARWEWLDFRVSLHGDSHVNNGNVLHMAEALTDKDGRYRLPGWGPKTRLTGILDDHNDPKLTFFKSGYAPRQVANKGWIDYMRNNPAAIRSSEWDGQLIKLERLPAEAKEYAKLVAAMQGDYRAGLWWRAESDQWKLMPHMGRAGRNGTAISLVNTREHSQVKTIERFTAQRIAVAVIEGLEPRVREFTKPANPGKRPGGKRWGKPAGKPAGRSFRQGRSGARTTS